MGFFICQIMTLERNCRELHEKMARADQRNSREKGMEQATLLK